LKEIKQMAYGKGLELLVGKTIERVLISSNKMELGFELTGGERMAFYTDGDCCSQSWIEAVENVDSLIGGKVTGANEIDMGDVTDTYDEADPPPQEFVQAYGVEVSVEGRPTFKLEFRNASNGYYGGSLRKAKHVKWEDLTLLSADFS
jgi:hypothetical protein